MPLAFPRVDTFQQQQKRLSLQGMEAFVDVVEVRSVWNMTILLHFHAEEQVPSQIFNCSVKNAIEASLTVVFAKYTIEGLEPIAVKERNPPNHPIFQVNAQVQQRRERDVKIKRPVQAAAAIFIKIF